MSRESMDRLLDEALSVAVHFLTKSGEFYPFAVALETSGGLRHLQGYPGEETPESAKVVELLEAGIGSGAKSGEFIGAALIKDVRVLVEPEKVDAVSVHIAHQGMPAVQAFLPYAIVDGVVTERPMLFERASNRFFQS